jgi:selenocysteine lyase/cysteine desulfurase
VGAWLLVDAVHFAPHFSLDVIELDIDFLICSAYKFYGPHVGILYSKSGILDELEPDRLRTQDQQSPFRIETGTLNHAAIAGVSAAVDYLANFGESPDPRNRLIEAMNCIQIYEHTLAVYIYEQITAIKGLTLYGPPIDAAKRTPTLSFTIDGKHPELVCRLLADKGICAWDGHFYAIRPVEILGLLEKGGLTRIGISIYNNKDEADRLVSALKMIARE